MKKKVVLSAVALILVSAGAFWGVKAAVAPGTSAQAMARNFLIQCYSIPDHSFYTQMLSTGQGSKAALEERFKIFLTDDFMSKFLMRRGTCQYEAWAKDKSYLVAIDQLNVQPTSSGTQDNTTYLEYDVTLTLTHESDKRLATYEQSGRVNVDKTKDGYRISAWDVNNEREFYSTDFFPEQ